MKILGLDLGVGSIGWALIDTDADFKSISILGMGSRIISLTPDESDNFNKGKGETVCSQRTAMRTARKTNYRYKMRRALLTALLAAFGMKDPANDYLALAPLALWKLRADAATPGRRLSLPEIGRVLLHLNQKRGYRHAKSDNSDSKQTEYVQTVNRNYADITEMGHTVGQHFYSRLKDSVQTSPEGKEVVTALIKGTVFPREAYKEEFDRIMNVQKEFYPEVLTEATIKQLKDAIFFQRPLKSCKHLVSVCEFEKRIFKNKDGKEVTVGPKVAPKSSPLAQVTRLYEVINNIRLTNSHNKTNRIACDGYPDGKLPKDARLLQYEYSLDAEERKRIFDYLNTHEKLTVTELLKLLGLKKKDGFQADQNLKSGIKGNDTYVKLFKALEGFPGREELLRFDIEFKDTDKVDIDTGEIIKEVSPDYIRQPLYQLWHTVYSISDRKELGKVLAEKFGITDDEIIDRLYAIDFVNAGYSNRSAKFMRKLLPLLTEGHGYAESCTIIGVNHSDSLSKEENEKRELKKFLDLLPKNSLRQPIVEKILNQMINVVNALIEKYGEIDEVRVELARSLKQSADERAEASLQIGKREKENKKISDMILELGIVPSRSRVQKYRMWEETGHKCMYCGKTIGVKEFIESHEAEVEHIIPRALFFDDSFSNKTCACRDCNSRKGKMTAYDFIRGKSEGELSAYIERVEQLLSAGKISKTKRNRLLTSENEIPQDFLERDLRQTQYISKKAREILQQSVRNVWASSGSVTDFLRHQWGYDMILHDLNLPRYEQAGLVEDVATEHKGQVHNVRKIKGWSKRLDHRHHAIDALTVALTRQGYVQRLNNLSAEHGNLYDDIKNENCEFRRNKSLLEQWAASRPHVDVNTVKAEVDRIAVSFKAGKKLATPSRRSIRRGGKTVVVQKDLLTPRGPLHMETVYGSVLLRAGKISLKNAFQDPDMIIDTSIREEVKKRIHDCGGDVEKAVSQLKSSPVIRHEKGEEIKVKETECFRKEYVVRKRLEDIKYKNLSAIVDSAIQEIVRNRFEECGKDDKKFQQSLQDNPLKDYNGRVIRKVRIVSGLKADSVVPVRKTSERNIGFAKTGSNHHVAFYEDENGKINTHVISFWTAVRRKLNGLPAIIENPSESWEILGSIRDESLREELAQTLPMPHWKFKESMQMNEMFVLGLSEEEYNDAVAANDYRKLSDHLYRIQKLSLNYYCFRFHTDTTTGDSKEDMEMQNYIRIQSTNALNAMNPHKVKTSVIGKIIYD